MTKKIKGTDPIEKFSKFFAELGELCFKIKMVERPKEIINFSQKGGQIIDPDYFDEVIRKYPKTMRGFWMAISQKSDSIHCYLQENGEVTVEFCERAGQKILKVISYKSVEDIRENRIALIHFLTWAW